MERFRDDLCDADAMAGALESALENTRERWKDKEPSVLPLFPTLVENYRLFSERVIRLSESPIEKMLFNALLFGCSVFDPFALIVREVEGDALEYVKQAKRVHASIRGGWQAAKRRGEHPAIRPEIDRRVAAGEMGEDEAEYWRTQEVGALLAGDSFQVIPQATLAGQGPKGRAIRVDALVYVVNRPQMLVAVECDGYEWHGNKESFDKDRRRDRTLKAIGCDVLRFSGAEIFRDPNEAALELHSQLTTLAGRSPKPRRWKAEG